MFSKQLVVLVGGKGTRLGTVTKDTPKPLVTIDQEKVFLDYFLETCVRQGFDDIVMLAGHLGDQVHQRYHNRRFGETRISVMVEPEPMGTGGALRFAEDRLAPTFLLANGDTLFDINIRAIDQRLQQDANLLGVMALREVDNTARYGQVKVDAAGIVQSFEEKKVTATPQAGLINGGIIALRKVALSHLPEGPSSAEVDLYPKLVAMGRFGGVEAHGYFLDIGLPETLQIARDELPARKRPVLFLDRDGVVNLDKNYVHKVEDFEWVKGIKGLIRLANDQGRAVIVVTNQAGIGRGFYTEADMHKLHEHIQRALYTEGAFIDGFYFCPYHQDAALERYRLKNHPDRKPNPGMLQKAIFDHDLDLTDGVLVGDNQTDMQAAVAVGIKGVLFSGGDIADLNIKL